MLIVIGVVILAIAVHFRQSHRIAPDAEPLPDRVVDQVTVMRERTTGEVRLPLPNHKAQMTMPFVFGAGAIVLGVLDLVG